MTKEKFTKAVYKQAKLEYKEPLTVSRDTEDEIQGFFNFYLSDTDYSIEKAIEKAVEVVIDESVYWNESMY